MTRFLTSSLLLLVVVAFADEVAASSTTTSHRLRHGRSLFCLGLFRLCANDDARAVDSETGEITCPEDRDGLLGLVDDVVDVVPCLGIFRDCEEEERIAAFCSGDATVSSAAAVELGDDGCPVKDETKIFGGRPLLGGNCSVVDEIISEIFGDSTDSGDEGIVGDVSEVIRENSIFNSNTTDEGGNADDNDTLLGFLPEGGLLWRIFNRDEDVSLVDSVLDEFGVSTSSFTTDFLNEWESTAVTTDQVCTVDTGGNVFDGDDECIERSGEVGFWVCRSLTNPFTGASTSKPVCIGQGDFLSTNDECGCCGESCPSCPCVCDLDGEFGNGRIIAVTDPNDGAVTTRCVATAWAASTVPRFDAIACLSADQCA